MCSTRYSQMSLDSDEDVIEVKDKRTVSDDQLYQLYKFLDKNRDVASETKKRLKLKWESITPILNFQDGARKNWQGWCEYWRNYRSKILIKIESESRLSDYEKKFYELFKEEPQAEVARKSHQPVVEVSTSTSRRQTVLENNDGVVTAKLCDEDKKLLLEVERLCKKIDARMAEMSSLLRRRP